MIEFKYSLPAMNIEGRHNGSYNNKELALPGVLTTRDVRLGEFMHQLRNIIWDDRSLVFVDGKKLAVSKNWIRDHVHEMKGFLHWEYDLGSFLDFIIDTQREDGQFYELIKQMDDYHWKMVNEDCRILYPEDNVSLVRLELEADIEYLVVEGAANYYRVTGDKEWVRRVLPKLEKGIDYMTSDPKRWDPEHGLCKRPFTIDTWDFCYNPEDHNRNANDRRISPTTPMSIMHGDNTGVFAAMKTLARFRRMLGEEKKAEEWEKRAEMLKDNIFRYLYNGTYFIHQLHLGHKGADDGLEEQRLSLSNTYALNRGILNEEQSRRMIDEYRNRREESGYFAEWFTVYPPYEDFIGYRAGEYVNGAISPFAAGELAKGAFNAGYEEYGWDILSRFISMMERDGKIYFLYSPVDCTPQDELGPSAWGAAGLLSAIDEGLAGVVDLDYGYRKIAFSPRFPVTPYDELRYLTGYEKCDAVVDIRYILTDEGMRYDVSSPAEEVNFHILLPKEKRASSCLVDGKPVAFTLKTVGNSLYTDFSVTGIRGKVSAEVIF